MSDIDQNVHVQETVPAPFISEIDEKGDAAVELDELLMRLHAIWADVTNDRDAIQRLGQSYGPDQFARDQRILNRYAAARLQRTTVTE